MQLIAPVLAEMTAAIHNQNFERVVQPKLSLLQALLNAELWTKFRNTYLVIRTAHFEYCSALLR